MDSGHYLIIGLGKTGHSIARYLQRCGATFVMFDTREETELATPFRNEFPDIDVFLGALPERLLASFKAVIISPGVPLETLCIQQAKALGLSIYGDIECLAREVTAPIVAITGTNGKSTVTSLLGLMAKAFGLKTAVAGNIGTPVLDLLQDDSDYDVWVLELSSFQLELTESLQAKAATILNISPDHLDRHHSMEAYIDAKQRVYLNSEFQLYNREDTLTNPQQDVDQDRRSSFGLSEAQDGQWGIEVDGTDTYLMYGRLRLIATSQLKIKGRHNWANALAACALAHRLGISFECMIDVLTTFPGLAHRSQWLRTINNVEWIDDSKGTNIGATQSAIAGIGDAISGKILLIAGGQGKGADFSALQSPVSKYVRTVILLGQDADKLDAALCDVVSVERVSTLDEAVAVAHRIAQSGDVVLLSPACASLDMFRDYNHRGEVFASLVDKL